MSSHQQAELDERDVFYEGIRLFNEGDWFEAHERWEDIWRQASGARKRFYQGLIQAAVVIEHIRRGNPRGMLSVWESCQPKFAGLPNVYMGIDIAKLLAGVKRLVDPVLALPASHFAPGVERGQKLPVDLTQAPRIELEYDPFT
jgi:hypothetical protein